MFFHFYQKPVSITVTYSYLKNHSCFHFAIFKIFKQVTGYYVI